MIHTNYIQQHCTMRTSDQKQTKGLDTESGVQQVLAKPLSLSLFLLSQNGIISSTSLARDTHRSILDLAPLHRRLSWTSRSCPHSHSVEQLLEHLHPLFSLFCHSCHTELLRELFAFACCWHCSSLFTGSRATSLAVSLSSRPLGTCFINQIQ